MTLVEAWYIAFIKATLSCSPELSLVYVAILVANSGWNFVIQLAEALNKRDHLWSHAHQSLFICSIKLADVTLAKVSCFVE